MKRKNIAFALVTIFTLSGFGLSVKADGTTTTLVDQAGITPDSILYPIDKLLDEAKISLSITAESKVNNTVQVAEERLGESEVMHGKGKIKEAKTALEDANKKMEDAETKAVEITKDAKDADSDAKVSKVQKTLESLTQKQQLFSEVLKNLEGKTTEDLKAKLQEVMDRNSERQLAVAAMVDSRHQLNDARKAVKEAEKSGDATKLQEAKAAYTEAQKNYSEVVTVKQEEVNKNEKDKKEVDKGKMDSQNEVNNSNASTDKQQAADKNKQSTVDNSKQQTGDSSKSHTSSSSQITEVKQDNKTENKDKEKSSNGQENKNENAQGKSNNGKK